MKRNRLLAFLLLVISIFTIVGCTKKPTVTTTTKINDPNVAFESNINLYTDEVFAYNSGIDFTYQKHAWYEYEGSNILEFEIVIECQNMLDYDTILTISNPKAYGNDLELVEQVLSNYDYEDKTKNTLFDTKVLNIKSKKKDTVEFHFVIKDGNKDAKYRLDYTINNVTMSVSLQEKNYTQDTFIYVHNPALNPKVLEDAEVDSNAVFGFKPNTTGSLSTYTSYDWTIESDVLIYKQNRIDYIEENDGRLKALENELKAQGKSIEEIARACSLLRNQIRLDQYKDDPEGLEQLKQRNMTKYGHEDGPTPDESYTKYGSWEMVLEKAYTTNRGMDACCGVYDLYFYLYNELPY